MNTPVCDFVKRYTAAAPVRMHMPGHKGRAPFEASSLYALDTTELPLTDNLHAPRGAIREAEARISADPVCRIPKAKIQASLEGTTERIPDFEQREYISSVGLRVLLSARTAEH